MRFTSNDYRSAGLRIALSIGVSFAIISLMMSLVNRGVSPGDRPELFAILSNTIGSFVFLYLLCSLAQGLFRAIRYKILLLADTEIESVPNLFHLCLVTAVRNMMVDMLPVRLGELSYIAMLNRGYKIHAPACISSLAVSFAFDLLALLPVLGVLIGYQVLDNSLNQWTIAILMIAMLFTVFVIAFLYRGIRWTVRGVDRILIIGRVQDRFKIFSQFLHKITSAVEHTFQAEIFVKTLVYSLLIRFFKYSGLVLLFKGVVIPNFHEFSQLPLAKIVIALIGAEGTASIPMPTFMSFGNYEAGGVAALSILGFAKMQSMLAMLAIHIWSQLGDYTIGMAAIILFVSTVFRQDKIPAGPRRGLAKRSLSWAIVIVILLGGITLAGWQYRAYQKLGSLTPPAPGVPVSDAADSMEFSSLRDILGNTNGFMVWSSNRFGNHEILYQSTNTKGIRQLTRHPHVDTFPRISPDGTKIVFARSQKEWVSCRNELPWDVYLFDMNSGKESLIARNGYTPTWAEDGKEIFFQRNGYQFVAYNLDSGSERILFEAGKGPVPAGASLQTPSYSQKVRKMAVTLRGSVRMTALFGAANGLVDKVGGGCQLAFSPDAAEVYHVDQPGKMRNAIYIAPVDQPGKNKLWLDLPGDYSHEYFPRLSNDSQFLILGASAGGHEHDTADYEIFIWKVRTTASSAKRITFHTGNDSWPDLYIKK